LIYVLCAAIPNSPILSPNGTMLYVASASTRILALDLELRSTAWVADDLSSTALSKAVYDNQGSADSVVSPVIYIMESSGGILRQYNALTGELNWFTDCSMNNPNGNNLNVVCSNVVADFTVLGNMLYYVDVAGNLVAMTVADFPIQLAPTPAPAAAPIVKPTARPSKPATLTTTDSPSIQPVTKNPTIASVPTATSPTFGLETNNPSSAGNTDGGISNDEKSTQSWLADNKLVVALSAGCATLMVLILLALCSYRKKRIRNNSGGKRMGNGDADLRNDETTVATTPGRSYDKSFEINDVTSISGKGSPLPSIEESQDDEDLHSAKDVENTLEVQNCPIDETDTEVVVQNLLERFAKTSFDMEEDDCGRITSATEEGLVSRESSSKSNLDNYSLASGDDKDDAASLTGTLSVASRGSTRSLKNSIMAVLGKARKQENEKESGSMTSENSKTKSDAGQAIDRNIVKYFQPSSSPIPSPRPEYPEPGIIRPGYSVSTSPLLSPGSPTQSLLSYDGSLYMDESTIASLEMPCNEELLHKLQDDALGGSADVGKLPSDCPEDEVTQKLQPGLVYLNRHIAKKEQFDQPTKSVGLDETKRVQPMYNGVSVRPASRSRAGLFSRRQPKITTSDENSADDVPGTPELTPEPTVLRTRRTLVAPSSPATSSPIVDSQGSLRSETQTPPPRFTAAGYYVEEPEPDDSLLHDASTEEWESNITSELEGRNEVDTNHVEQKKDTWNSFLSELSKVEKQFFNPTAKSNNITKAAEQKSRPPRPAALPLPPPDIKDSESDEEEQDTVLPPPPRTFYA
jgi:hypothetical protein